MCEPMKSPFLLKLAESTIPSLAISAEPANTKTKGLVLKRGNRHLYENSPVAWGWLSGLQRLLKDLRLDSPSPKHLRVAGHIVTPAQGFFSFVQNYRRIAGDHWLLAQLHVQ